MNIQRLSISLSQQQYDFIEKYQAEHHYKTRSEVIRKALYLLQLTQLEACYRETSQKRVDAFETTSLDGLDENETW